MNIETILVPISSDAVRPAMMRTALAAAKAVGAHADALFVDHQAASTTNAAATPVLMSH